MNGSNDRLTIVDEGVISVGLPGGSIPGPVGPQGPAGPPGVTWRGPWSQTTAYVPNDLVNFGVASYIALVDTIGQYPDANPSVWDFFAGITS